MKDVLASLYSLHPCLIAETQALAAKRMLSGSIYQYPHQMNTKPAGPVGLAAVEYPKPGVAYIGAAL
jgi:hypothetical protein